MITYIPKTGDFRLQTVMLPKKVNVIVVLFLIAAMGASLFAGINFAKAEENEVYHGEFIGLSGDLSDREL